MSVIITLTTDFGAVDGYAGAMKGIVLDACPEAKIVDISHDVPPQDVLHAAFVLWTASAYFPPETIHICVVDPEVGTSRRPILIDTPRGRFIGPDNGVFTYVLTGGRPENRVDLGEVSVGVGDYEFMKVRLPGGWTAYELNNTDFWRHEVSSTFHGRDIFAPVAAHLANGVGPQKIGTRVKDVISLNMASPTCDKDGVSGRVIYVDRFGNLITNVHGSDVQTDVDIAIGNVIISGLSDNYAESDSLVALLGSSGYVEIAVKNGSAARKLSANVGSRVTVGPSAIRQRATPRGSSSN